jgi:glycosyltransferase involved in cell wall biosynthesis
MLRGFLDEDRLLVLNRTLIQKQPAVIHNINSPLGYDLFERHGRSLAAGSRLFASAFCEDLSPEVKRGGPAFERLPRCIDDLSAVLCDNRAFPSRLIGIYDFPPGKVMTVYFPAPPQAPRPEGDHRGPELRVLWASRLDWQKRPDVLLEVASACSGMPVVFHVYGESVLDPAGKRYKRRLAGRRNVILHGAYDGFESIPAREHDVFLYTSQSDGLPNVLLEAMATGLPVIAPLVGGIGELVTEDTGFPVSGPDAVGEYVGRLREVLADRSLAGPRVRAATELLRERHSRKAFVARLREVPGYLSGASPAEEKQG